MAQGNSRKGYDWGTFTTAATLPNVMTTGVVQDRNLRVGDTAYVAGAVNKKYVCVTATVNAATWEQITST